MTDKEIITDGIDVSECHNYNSKNGKCPIPYWIGYIKCTGLNCSDIKDCYFKLFKRKEQECEELKEKIKELLHDCNSCKFHQYKQAELKLEEIKEIVVPIKENTCFGMHCGVINWILKIIEGQTDINNIVSDTVHIQKIGDVTVKDGE